jgi:outer membrane protein
MSEEQMKKIIYGVAGACVLLVAATAFLFFKVRALDSRGGAKIGYVKSDALLGQYKPAMAVQQKIQMESAEAQKDLEGRYKELQVMDADLKKKSEVLTAQALAPQVEKFQKKQNEFYQLQQATQQGMQQKQSQLLEPIFQDISTFINKYGKDNGYTIILGTPVEGLLVYGETAADLTEVILNELNSKVPPTIPVPFSTRDTSKKK